jgi:hypothetical protein
MKRLIMSVIVLGLASPITSVVAQSRRRTSSVGTHVSPRFLRGLSKVRQRLRQEGSAESERYRSAALTKFHAWALFGKREPIRV